jgi:trans-aconitate 2-methyltransferase
MRILPSPSLRKLRMNAALDLLRRIPSSTPRRVAYLRGGPESSTELLFRRFPDAEIVGIEHSQIPLDPMSTRVPGDARGSEAASPHPTDTFDLICVNGTLEIMPSVRQLLPRLLSFVATGGRLAIHIPKNAHEPNRALARLVAADGPWAKKLVPIPKTRPFDETVDDLYDLLCSLCASLEIWGAATTPSGVVLPRFRCARRAAPGFVRWLRACVRVQSVRTDRNAFNSRSRFALVFG